VALLLVALVVFPFTGLNAWPFSNWELFSRLRTDSQAGWEAVAVGRRRRRSDFELASLPHGYRGFPFIMNGFFARSVADRDAICATWLRAAIERFGAGTRRLRIYRLRWRLDRRRGDRAAPPRRTLKWTCSARGARAAS